MEEDSELERWMFSTIKLFGTVELKLCQPHCICIVPDELRKRNEKAFEPKVVSMGPRYKGRRDLLPMEEIKWHCIMSFLSRTKGPRPDGTLDPVLKNLKSCIQTMLEFDGAVRASYGEEIKLDRYDLATIMLYDGCFLLELLICGSPDLDATLQSEWYTHGPGSEVGKMEEVLRDLMLVENQIPLFILYKLFEIIFPPLNFNNGIREIVEDLALSLFVYSNDSRPEFSPTNYINATHFLELAHSYVLKENDHQSQRQQSSYVVGTDINKQVKQVKLNRCVTRLQAAGVRIKREEDINSVVPISRGSKFRIKFSNGVLQIPTLDITQTTEARWRNFIAWEHHKNKWSKTAGGEVFTFFALLFNDLVCCASDVQVLKNKGIIVDHSGMNNHDVVDLFRCISNGVDRGLVDYSSYAAMIHDLNNYSARNCVVRFPVIAWHCLSRISEWLYRFRKFFGRGYNFAVSLVTVLTFIQTYYAVVTYSFPNDDKSNSSSCSCPH